MKAIRVHETGGPDALRYEDVPAAEPGPGEARVRVEAAGVNYIDVYHRIGLYPLDPPFTPGMEAAGVVGAVGPGVSEVAVGDRVAYAMHLGAYAEEAVVPAARLVRLPKDVSAGQGAAAMLQGMTAHYLALDAFPLAAGRTALVHAAAGGVGLLLVQIATRLGATVYGTVSTEEKAALAREAGAEHVILYTKQDFETEVRRLTGGLGVDVVYDAIGKDTFEKSLHCLRRRGTLVLYGQASGKVPPVDLAILQAKGSLYVTRPGLAHYVAERADLLRRAQDVFGWIAAGELKLRIHAAIPLREAARAHRELESRKTMGKLLLIP
ncbi:MAG: quinone oxidoreductase family protein [Gemmatimonadota bacterium]